MSVTPNGNETFDFTPHNLPARHLAALGLLSAAASSTDSIIEMAIAGLLGVDGEQGYAVTAHMPAPLRASVLASTAEIVFDDPDVLDRLDTLLNAIKKAAAERNAMIHGTWCVRPSDNAVLLVSQQARTHVEIKSVPVTVNEIERKAIQLYTAGIDLMQFLIDHGRVPALPRARQRGVNTPQARKARRKKAAQ